MRLNTGDLSGGLVSRSTSFLRPISASCHETKSGVEEMFVHEARIEILDTIPRSQS